MLQPSRNMLRLTRADTFQMPSCLVESSSLHKEYRLPCRSSTGLTVGHDTHPPFLQYSPFPSRFRPLDYGDCLTQGTLRRCDDMSRQNSFMQWQLPSHIRALLQVDAKRCGAAHPVFESAGPRVDAVLLRPSLKSECRWRHKQSPCLLANSNIIEHRTRARGSSGELLPGVLNCFVD